MEYDKEDNGAAGSIPEFGAIFMSSIVTKKECFKRKLFALPSSKGKFIEHVKAGMVLFLFEFEKRRLFGVYQASSDGAMDIAPHAFNYSGKRFPAQVCFTPIWYCNPLSENEFRDAIRENYYSPKKFNFGLSEVQVHRLLHLFSAKKLKHKLPPFRMPEVHNGIEREDEMQVYDDRYPLSERGYIHSMERDRYTPAVIHDYQMNSFDRLNEDDFLVYNGGIGEGKIHPLGQGGFLAKRRRIDNDDRLIGKEVVENEIYSNEILNAFATDSSEDSMDEVLRLENARRLSRIERVLKENHVDKFLNPALPSDNTVGSLDVSAPGDIQFVRRKKLLSEYDVEHGPGVAFASESYGNPLDTKHPGERFVFDECVQRERDICDLDKPFVYGDDKVYSCRQSREVIDDHRCSMDRKWKNQYYLDSAGGHARYFECSLNLLHKKKKATVGETIPVHCRIQSEPTHISLSTEGFSSENSAHPMHYGQRLIHDRKYPTLERRVTDNAKDNILCSTGQTRITGCYGRVDGQVVDAGRYIGADNKVDTQTHDSPIVSKEYSSLPEQSISPFFGKLPEKRLSQLQVDHKFESSRSMFADATITRSVPYIPEYPNFTCGYSAAMITNDGNFGLVQENYHQNDSLEDFSIMSPYLPGSERDLDIAPAGEASPACTSAQQCSIPHYTSTSFLNSKLSRQTAQDTSTPVNYRGSLFQKSSPALLPNHDLRNIERERGYFGYPSTLSKSHFAFDGNLATPSQADCVPQQKRSISIGKDISNGSGVGVYDQVSDLNCKEHQERSEAPHRNSGKRKSVFTRLTSRQESWVGKERSGINYNSNDRYMNASADEIMNMLHRGNSTRNTKNNRLVGMSKNAQGAVDEKQIQSHAEAIHSIQEKKINEVPSDVEESVDEVPKETRIVNFKRRRETRKSTDSAADSKIVNNNKMVKLTGNDSTANDGTIGVNEVAESSVIKTSKRRRLIRPVFGKVETATDVLSSKENLPSVALYKDVKQNCEKAISNSEEAGVPNDKQNYDKAISSSEVDDKQNCNKAIRRSETEVHDVQKYCNNATNSNAEVGAGDTTLGNLVTSCPPQSLECSTVEDSNPEVQNVLSSASHEVEGHEIVALDGSTNLLPMETPEP